MVLTPCITKLFHQLAKVIVYQKNQDDYKRISCQSLPSDLNQLVNQYLVIH